MAGMIAANMAQTGKALSRPSGQISHPLPGSDVDNPSGTIKLSVYVSGETAVNAPITTIAIGTPKSPNARRT